MESGDYSWLGGVSEDDDSAGSSVCWLCGGLHSNKHGRSEADAVQPGFGVAMSTWLSVMRIGSRPISTSLRIGELSRAGAKKAIDIFPELPTSS